MRSYGSDLFFGSKNYKSTYLYVTWMVISQSLMCYAFNICRHAYGYLQLQMGQGTSTVEAGVGIFPCLS